MVFTFSLVDLIIFCILSFIFWGFVFSMVYSGDTERIKELKKEIRELKGAGVEIKR